MHFSALPTGISALHLQQVVTFHSSWKVTKLLHETEAKVDLVRLEKWK